MDKNQPISPALLRVCHDQKGSFEREAAAGVLFKMKAILTNHSIDRAKERCGWNRCALERMADKALESGISQKDVSGRLRRYIDKHSIQHPGHRSFIHGNVVFVFAGVTLITVLDLPKEFQRAAKASRK